MNTTKHLSLLLAGAAFSTLSAMAAPGYINGTLTTGGQANVNLTALGVTDWAVWGYGDGGTSTSLAPDVTLAGGTGISDLTYIDPNTQPLRGIGQFRVNYGFSWSNGGTDTAETGAFAGLQSYTSGTGNGVGEGFSFTVPAGTVEQQLDVFVDANVAVGEITASLSGGGVTPYADDSIRYGGNSPGEYVIDYAAPTDGQTLTVQWAETAADATQDNPAIFAVALSPVPEPADWALMAGGALLLAGWRRSKAVVGR